MDEQAGSVTVANPDVEPGAIPIPRDLSLDEIKERVGEEAFTELDEMMKAAQASFGKSTISFSLPEVIGDYTAIEGKAGIYRRAMCIETEYRALELYGTVGDGTPAGLLRIGIGLAACVLFRLNLPDDEGEARQKILDFVRGKVSEDDVFVPLTEREVGRMFRNSEELDKAVLGPLGYEISPNEDGGAEVAPNA